VPVVKFNDINCVVPPRLHGVDVGLNEVKSTRPPATNGFAKIFSPVIAFFHPS